MELEIEDIMDKKKNRTLKEKIIDKEPCPKGQGIFSNGNKR